MTTAYRQEHQSNKQNLDRHRNLQSATQPKIVSLISDDEDGFPPTKTTQKTLEVTRKDDRSSKHDVLQHQKARLQEDDKQPKKKCRSTPTKTIEKDQASRNRPEPKISHRNSPEIFAAEEPSLSSPKPMQVIGIQIPAQIPFGWVDYTPNTSNKTSRQVSIPLQPSIEMTPPPPSRDRKRSRYVTIVQSSSSSSSEMDEAIKENFLRTSSTNARNRSIPKAPPNPELLFVEDEADVSISGSGVLSTRQNRLFSPTLPTSKSSNSKMHPLERPAPGPYHTNLSNGDESRSKKSNSKSRSNRNLPESDVSLSRGPSSDLYSSGQNAFKPKQVTHKHRIPAAIAGNGNISPEQSSKNGRKPKSVRPRADSSSSTASDTDMASRQKPYTSLGLKGLRPRVIKETDSQKMAREWKVKYKNHPFMHHLNSLKDNVDIVNEVDQDPPPDNFKFIRKNIFVGQAIEPDPAATYGCSCRPNCDPKSCSCVSERNDEYDSDGTTWGLPYNVHKRLTHAYLNSPLAIHECNEACACSPSCRNRNVTLPHDFNLEIFKTPNRGWGLRSRDPIFKGQFVDTYRGEVLTDEEAIARSERSINKNVYLFSLDKFTSELPPGETEYVIDAEFMGSSARFINHSCDPNLRVICVSLLRGNPRVYEVAFFAARDIPPGEELSFDYQNMDGDDDRWDDTPEQENQRVDCLCGAPRCRRHFW